MKKKKFKYVGTIFNSLPEVFKQPLLLVPFFFGAFIAITYSIFNANIAQKLNSPIPNMNLIFVSFLVLLLYVAIQMLIGSTVLASIRMYIDSKKLTVNKEFNGGLVLYWKYFGLSICKGLIILVPILLLTFIGFIIVFSTASGAGIAPSSIVPIIILIIIMLLLILFLGLIFMFADVIITEGKGIFDALKGSYNVFRHHFGHSFKTMLSLILFMLVYWGILSLLIGLIFGFDTLFLQNQTGTELSGLLMNLLVVPASATAILYIFKSRKQSLVLMKKKK